MYALVLYFAFGAALRSLRLLYAAFGPNKAVFASWISPKPIVALVVVSEIIRGAMFDGLYFACYIVGRILVHAAILLQLVQNLLRLLERASVL